MNLRKDHYQKVVCFRRGKQAAEHTPCYACLPIIPDGCYDLAMVRDVSLGRIVSEHLARGQALFQEGAGVAARCKGPRVVILVRSVVPDVWWRLASPPYTTSSARFH